MYTCTCTCILTESSSLIRKNSDSDAIFTSTVKIAIHVMMYMYMCMYMYLRHRKLNRKKNCRKIEKFLPTREGSKVGKTILSGETSMYIHYVHLHVQP